MNIISNQHGIVSFEVCGTWYFMYPAGHHKAGRSLVASHTVGWYFDSQGLVWTSDFRKKT